MDDNQLFEPSPHAIKYYQMQLNVYSRNLHWIEVYTELLLLIVNRAPALARSGYSILNCWSLMVLSGARLSGDSRVQQCIRFGLCKMLSDGIIFSSVPARCKVWPVTARSRVLATKPCSLPAAPITHHRSCRNKCLKTSNYETNQKKNILIVFNWRRF